MRFILVALPVAFIGAVSAASIRLQVDLTDQSLNAGRASSLESSQVLDPTCMPKNTPCDSAKYCCSHVCAGYDRAMVCL
ncbi:hypothetical protein DFH09DRAFT_1368188 [Mycena vulgaris]|nr:hypothetical protein DFH09DRAFT_1368188 [Mycena vulgaris]